MIYHSFQDLQLSSLGFGTMRLPLLENGSIDMVELDRMVDTAITSGVNYFDTALPYHEGNSETAIGKSLSRYPRESWYLADKFPGHQNVPGVTPLDPEEYFFLHALLYGEKWSDRLKERHLQLSMLADSINEKMMDLIGDTVIEFAGDTPEIIEDYTEELREMIPE